MLRISKQLLSGLVAALLISVVASGAAANRIGFGESQLRIIWPDFRYNTSAGSAECQVTLLATFHSRTISKVSHLVFGNITSTTLGPCDSGVTTILRETLPWYVSYTGFNGFLPNLTGLNQLILGMNIRVNIGGISCLMRTDETEPAGGTTMLSGGTVTRFDLDSDYVIDIDDSGFFCSIAGDSTFSGSGSVTTAAGGTLRLTLV